MKLVKWYFTTKTVFFCRRFYSSVPFQDQLQRCDQYGFFSMALTMHWCAGYTPKIIQCFINLQEKNAISQQKFPIEFLQVLVDIEGKNQPFAFLSLNKDLIFQLKPQPDISRSKSKQENTKTFGKAALFALSKNQKMFQSFLVNSICESGFIPKISGSESRSEPCSQISVPIKKIPVIIEHCRSIDWFSFETLCAIWYHLFNLKA